MFSEPIISSVCVERLVRFESSLKSSHPNLKLYRVEIRLIAFDCLCF